MSNRNRFRGYKSYPTVDDLRVKQCYICLEVEERKQDVEIAPSSQKRWVHPCRCSMVVHEDCIRQWAFVRGYWPEKCPQCGAKYEYIRRSPIYGFTSVIERFCNVAGRAFAVGGSVAALTGAFASISLARGLLTFRLFFGHDICELLWNRSFEGWSLFNISSLLQLSFSAGISGPIGIALWPSTPPLSVRRKLIEQSSSFFGSRHPRQMSFHNPELSRTWPPSQFLIGCLVAPLTKALYLNARSFASKLILGPQAQDGNAERNNRLWNNLPRRPWDVGLGNIGNPLAGGPPQGQGAAAPRPGLRGSIYELGSSLARSIVSQIALIGIGKILCVGAEYCHPLKQFLGIGPSIAELGLPRPQLIGLHWKPTVSNEKYWKRYTEWVWEETDAVWFRHCIPCLLFQVGADSFNLFTQWLAKHEAKGLRIKSRDFAGVDISTLDLIPRRQ